MQAGWLLGNLIAFCLQIAVLVLLAATVAWPIWRHVPRARLLGGQILLSVCLLLPLVQPWRPMVEPAPQPSISATPAGTPQPIPTSAPSRNPIPWAALILSVLAAGFIGRLLLLVVRIGRLRRYRRHASPLEPAPAWSVEADLRISDAEASPVTFGWRHPVVLLPPDFLSLPGAVQDAILCHEVMHVRRHDWLLTVAEEAVCALLWFHPAIWWLTVEIALAREQEVDRQAIAITAQPADYIDALLLMAGVHPCSDFTPAPLFLRKQYLRRRMRAILDERPVARTRARVLYTAATALVLILLAGWALPAAFPLKGLPQFEAYAITTSPAEAIDGKWDGVLYGGISVVGMPEDSRRLLLSNLPVRVGDPFTAQSMGWVVQTVERFDPRISAETTYLHLPDGGRREALLEISAPRSGPRPVRRIRVSDYLIAANAVGKVQPVSPSGTGGNVLLDIVIGTEGDVTEVRPVHGPPMLIPATVDAARQWQFRRTLVNGSPVEVETQLEFKIPGR